MFEIIEHDALVGWKMKPHISKQIDLVDVEKIPIRSNREGFWDKEFEREKKEGRCRIAFLGDSFTWGLGVREEERFSNLLEAQDSRWENLNFGVPGFGIDQSLLTWRHFTRSYRPDLVILTIYDNDFRDNLYLIRYGRPKPYFELGDDNQLELRNTPVPPEDFWDNGIFNQPAPPYVQFFDEPIERRSRVVHWVAKHSDLARFIYTRLRGTTANAPSPNPLPLLGGEGKGEEGIRLLIALVIQLSKEVHNANAKFAVAFAGRLIPEHQAAMKILEENGIPIIVATTEVLEHQLLSENKTVYYPYSKHWTPAAHRAVASLLAGKIEEQRLCEHSSPR